MKFVASAILVLALAGAAQAATPLTLVTYSPVTIAGTVTTSGSTFVSGSSSHKIKGVTITTVTHTTSAPVTKFTNKDILKKVVSGSTGFALMEKVQYNANGSIASAGLFAVKKGATDVAVSGTGAFGFTLPAFGPLNDSVTETVATVVTTGSLGVTTTKLDTTGVGSVTALGIPANYVGVATADTEVFTKSKAEYVYTKGTLEGSFAGTGISSIVLGTISVAAPTEFVLQ